MPQKKATVITAVGAGGKTTYLEKRAADYVRRGMRAVITTTTHIWKPETAAASTGDAFERYVFHTESGIDYAGTPEESGKLSAPPAEVLDWIIASYDAVLVEGDGSHCMPVKIPGPGEPVIPDGKEGDMVLHVLLITPLKRYRVHQTGFLQIADTEESKEVFPLFLGLRQGFRPADLAALIGIKNHGGHDDSTGEQPMIRGTGNLGQDTASSGGLAGNGHLVRASTKGCNIPPDPA